MTMDFGPICSGCTRDWDDRLGYCEHCDAVADDAAAEKKPKKKKKKKTKFTVITGGLVRRRTETETPVYDQLTTDFGFAPDQSADWRNMPGGAGLLEDNFS